MRVTGEQRRKIVVTGGAGFVGSQLGYYLHQAGHDVILLDNMSYGHLDNLVSEGQLFGRFICMDIRDSNLEAIFEGADCVFHLAGIAPLPACQEDPGTALDVNLGGTARVLEAVRRAGVRRLVFSSTSAVYENNKEDILHEDLLVQPDLVYAMSKKMSEDVCRAYAQNYGLDIIICRFFNVYGPHQDIERTSPPFTSYVARELVKGERPVLYNKSYAPRDYVHTEDVIALLVAMFSAKGPYSADVFNVCSGSGFSVPELYDIFREISGRTIDPEFRAPETFWDQYSGLFRGNAPFSRERVLKEVNKRAIGSNERARREFGWQPRIDIKDGIRIVYQDAQRRFSRASE